MIYEIKKHILQTPRSIMCVDSLWMLSTFKNKIKRSFPVGVIKQIENDNFSSAKRVLMVNYSSECVYMHSLHTVVKYLANHDLIQ